MLFKLKCLRNFQSVRSNFKFLSCNLTTRGCFAKKVISLQEEQMGPHLKLSLSEQVIKILIYYEEGNKGIPMGFFINSEKYKEFVSFFFFFYLPYLSSIHEIANCIAMFWTVCPHSLGSCYFRDVWATCRPHEGGASR